MIAGVMMAKRSGPPATSDDDPLAKLVAAQKLQGDVPPEELDGRDVTFPAILSDQDSPTTALAAVKDERGRLVEQPEDLGLPRGSNAAPPPAADRLPVVPLPAGTLLSSTPVTTEPRDELTAMAAKVSTAGDGSGELAKEGNDGGYQIQVASFKQKEDADAFVLELRKRGHEAFRQAAHVPDRGLWHRVRIGPFKTKFKADLYAKKFEKSERISPFVVDPHKVERAEEIRQAKLAARRRKYGP